MAGVTEVSAPQSAWLEELADCDMDWDSISLPSTPTRLVSRTAALSSSTEGDASLSGFSNPIPYSDLPSSTDYDLFCDTAVLETFLCETEGVNFSSTALTSTSTSTLASTPANSKIRPGSSSSNTSPLQTPRRIIRSNFSPALKSNSPIPGLNSSTCLRTLFCLGEALNKGVPLFDDDTRVFLDGKDYGGKMCRCLGKMTRQGSKWVFDLVSIWQATLDDIEYVAAVVT
ncbi:hypothetical protein E4T50_12998 [Aureobasidium sp. EXF-12298]|nr:hypothetical protein E4T50_12998 [Aureobasidium sp. EXF-12298]